MKIKKKIENRIEEWLTARVNMVLDASYAVLLDWLDKYSIPPEEKPSASDFGEAVLAKMKGE